jgi:hypothetical protein
MRIRLDTVPSTSPRGARTGSPLPMAKLLVLSATTWLPWRPLGVGFDFEPLAVNFLIFMGVIVLLRVLAADAMKKLFYRKTDPMTPARHD